MQTVMHNDLYYKFSSEYNDKTNSIDILLDHNQDTYKYNITYINLMEIKEFHKLITPENISINNENNLIVNLSIIINSKKSDVNFSFPGKYSKKNTKTLSEFNYVNITPITFVATPEIKVPEIAGSSYFRCDIYTKGTFKISSLDKYKISTGVTKNIWLPVSGKINFECSDESKIIIDAVI